jgi:hypothetical protein
MHLYSLSIVQVLDAGTVPHLNRLTKSDSAYVRKFTGMVLSNIAVDKDNQPKMAR